MQVNLINLLFNVATLWTGIFGVLLNYMEDYLPGCIKCSYRYGKFSSNTYQPVITRTEVPKRWFKHFYMFAAPASSYMLYLVINKYMWNGNIPRSIIWILNISLGPNRKALVSSENTFIAILVLTIHCWKRFYETQYVNIFSDKMMHISHYIIGFYHYVGTLISVVGESEGFVDGSKSHFAWRKITCCSLICALIILLSSRAQFKANRILSDLRKQKDGKVTSETYKIPYGGLFKYVSGALQITEITIYVSLSVILWQSSTYHYVTIWVLANQISTAVLTHRWYLETFKNYPKSRKILIPYLF